ncbi:MAG: hypothetical protein ACRCYR_11570 [Phycicoccus sp.]
MTTPPGSNLVVVDTDVWSHLFAIKKREHPQLARWQSLLTGKTVVVAAQTRAEVLAWCLMRDLGPRRSGAIRSQLDDTPTIPTSLSSTVVRYDNPTARLAASAS